MERLSLQLCLCCCLYSIPRLADLEQPRACIATSTSLRPRRDLVLAVLWAISCNYTSSTVHHPSLLLTMSSPTPDVVTSAQTPVSEEKKQPPPYSSSSSAAESASDNNNANKNDSEEVHPGQVLEFAHASYAIPTTKRRRGLLGVYDKTAIQVAILGVVTFLTPGMFNVGIPFSLFKTHR
jgi:hypothetical protein